MSQIIVTSRYLKSGTAKTKSQRKNYTKYIATRETVEIREQKKYCTENQEKLLHELLDDFPESKKYLEYDDYKNDPTAENAGELISAIIERSADVIGNRQNFVGYMAMRPGVEKRGAHGLFSEKDEPIILDRVASEVANHPGNVWSHVVSLRREDAVRLGYDNSDRWRELVMRHIGDIAEQTKIPLCNLKWYGAFHDTTHHPHIHLIVYSTNPKQGFLTKQGIDKIRSVFANDIFHDDLQSIYQEQTVRRDELKMESKKYVEKLLSEIKSGSFSNMELEQLVQTLKVQLDNTKGKKVYGYLKPEVKKTVDDIFKILSQNKSISDLYEKWCEMERQKYKAYTQKEKEFPPLYENKFFQPVRNMIIQQVSEMNSALGFNEPESIYKSYSEVMLSDKKQSKIRQALTLIEGDDVKKGIAMLTECADSGNTFACYKLGKIYLDSNNFDKAEKYLLAAGENRYAQYALGKLYLKEEKYDAQKAVECLEKCADENAWANYRLGILYLRGASNIERDTEKAAEYLSAASEQGSEYAQELLENMEQNESAMMANTVMSLFVNLSRCIADDYNQKFRSGRMSVDRKLRQMMSEKKQALGLKNEHNFE